MNVSMDIQLNVNLSAILLALTADLRRWRVRETDEEQYRLFTLRGIELRADNRPEEELNAVIAQPELLANAVCRLADSAADVAWRRDTTRAVRDGSAWNQLTVLARDAQSIQCRLGEIAILYRCDGESLREAYEGRRLMWQSM